MVRHKLNDVTTFLHNKCPISPLAVPKVDREVELV
jgi:hypothetical protein